MGYILVTSKILACILIATDAGSVISCGVHLIIIIDISGAVMQGLRSTSVVEHLE